MQQLMSSVMKKLPYRMRLVPRSPVAELPLRYRLRGRAARMLYRVPVPVALKMTRVLDFRTPHRDVDANLNLIFAIKHRFEGGMHVAKDDIETSRLAMRRDLLGIANPPTRVRKVRDFEIEGNEGIKLKLRHYVPLNEDSGLPLMLFIHGGGFMVGDIDTHDEACRVMANAGRFQIVSVDYRLCPEHDSLTPMNDALTALKWLQNHAGRFGKQRGQIVVAGDSAGGNISTVICQQTAGTPDVPMAQLLIYPVVDFKESYESHGLFDEFLIIGRDEFALFKLIFAHSSGLELSDPRISPMYGDLANQPPAMVVTSAFDVVRDEGEAYAKKLKEAGNVVVTERVARQSHAFINMTPINRRAKVATERMSRSFASLCRDIMARKQAPSLVA